MLNRFTRLTAPFVLLALIFMSACSSAPVPSGTVTNATITSLSLTGATIHFDVELANPCKVELPAGKLDYKLTSQSDAFVSGTVNNIAPIPAKGTSKIEFSSEVIFADALQKLSGNHEPGAVINYAAELELKPASLPKRMDLPPDFKIEFKKDGRLPIPAVPEVTLRGVAWSSLKPDEMRGRMTLRIRNTNGFAIDLAEFEWDFGLNGHHIKSGELQNAGSFGPLQERDLALELQFDKATYGPEFPQMLSAGSAEYKFYGRMKLHNEYAPIEVEWESRGQMPLR